MSAHSHTADENAGLLYRDGDGNWILLGEGGVKYEIASKNSPLGNAMDVRLSARSDTRDTVLEETARQLKRLATHSGDVPPFLQSEDGMLAWQAAAQFYIGAVLALKNNAAPQADPQPATMPADRTTAPAGAASNVVQVMPLAPHVDGQNFYELCQQYRHAQEMMPHGIPNVVQAFNNLREYIKTGKLPWPSYEDAAPQDRVNKSLSPSAGSPSTLPSESPAVAAPDDRVDDGLRGPQDLATPCVVQSPSVTVPLEPTEAMVDSMANEYENNTDGFTSDYLRALYRAALAAAPSAVPDADCLTCYGDPEVCASVPGLRHCEKAMRQAKVPAARTTEGGK